ncbi:MAG: M1 family aminopeptidase [Byssovorax sp.]
MLRPFAGAPPLAAIAICAASGCVPGNDLTRAPPPIASTDAAPIAPAPLDSGRLPGTARPLRYDVALAIDPAKSRFTGDVGITVEIAAATQAIVLHGRDLTIGRAEVVQGDQHVAATASTRLAKGPRDAPDELVLTLARPLGVGRAEIKIAWSAPIGDKLSGLYRVKEDGVYYAYTQLEPTDARRMIPCFDEPGFKVPFELKVTTPKGNLAVANAEETGRADADEGRSTTFHFAPTAPLPTYLFALAVGPFEIREAPPGPVKIRVITTRGKAALGDLVLEAAAAHTRLLGEYFDRPYPYSKLDLVAVPEFGFGAMENAGLISFREELILLDAQRAGAAARRTMATNVAHEISHHWFGNLVTMAWWDDLWLNEGFATWMESKIVDTWRPTMDARLQALRSKGTIMERDALDSARPVRQPISGSGEAEDAFDEITYDKGAAVLGMLEAWLGETTMRDGIRAYLKAHEHGSATSADLFQAIGSAANKDVGAIASTFLDQPGVPLVRAELVCDKAAAPRVHLTQRRYRASRAGVGADHEPDHRTWKIPICVAYEGGEKAGVTCGLLDGEAADLALPAGRCPKWIYPNAGENGYYRFVLPPAQMEALAAAARGLDPRLRMGMVAGSWALVRSGDMAVGTLLDLLEGMKRERHRPVLEEIIAALQGVSDTLVDEAARPAFRRYVASILLPIARELGWETRKADTDDQKLLRKSVLSALSTLAEDPWLDAEAEKRSRAFLANPRSLDPDMAAIALHHAARRGGERRFDELISAAKRAKLPEERIDAVGPLGSFADPVLLRRALDLMLTDQLRIQDSFYISSSAMRWPDSRPVVRAWVRDHFTELKGKMPDFLLTRLGGVVESICEKTERDAAAKLFGEAMKGTEGGDRALKQALEVADECIELRAREGANLKKKLGGKKAQ